MDEQSALRQAKEAIQRGDRVAARALLRQAIEANPRSEVGWLWLSAIVDDRAMERDCLERVLAINPANDIARQGLERLGQSPRAGASVPSRTDASWSYAQATAQADPVPEPSGPAAPSVLELYGAGLVLPAISPTFYWHAARRQAMQAFYFLMLFALALTTLQTLGVSHTFGAMLREVDQSFASGAFPQITLRGGQATVRGPDPFVREFEGQAVVIVDTTGRYGPAVLGSGRYVSGFLLTRTTLYTLNRGELESVPLSQLQSMLGDPFTLDVAVVRNLLNWLQLVSFFALLIANTLGRLISLLVLCLLVRAVANAFWTGVTFGPVFTVGVYAWVPATYGTYLLDRIGVSFCLLPTLLHLAIWVVGLIAAFAKPGEGLFKGGRPLRAWRALFGAPMLLLLALDRVFAWSWGGVAAIAVTLLTLTALSFVGLWPLLGQGESATQPHSRAG